MQLAAPLLSIAPAAHAAAGVRFEGSYPVARTRPVDGRILLVVAKANERRPHELEVLNPTF